jgi:glycosyltransferase involved in cell wall biosynthesis
MKIPLSIVIPVKNEAASIEAVLGDIKKAKFPPYTQVIVVDDCSNDSSGSLAKKQGARVLTAPALGYGGALKKGFTRAKGEWIAFLDGDATYPVKTLKKMWLLRKKSSGFIMANRLAFSNHMPVLRRLGNINFSFLAGFLSGVKIKDLCSGQRMFKRKFIKLAFNLPDGLDFSPAFTLAVIKKGFKITWVETDYLERKGFSKLSVIKDGCKFLYRIFKGV